MRGRLLERNVQYWAFDGAVLYVISATAVDQPEVCEFTHGSLQLFEPYLAETAENLRLPRP